MTRRATRRAALAAATTTTALLGLPLLPATPAAAATTITVTTTTDIVDGGDGLLSLREAISQANTTPNATEIVLAPAATYSLSLCEDGDMDDANAFGDLDITGSNDVTITGNDATIHQTCRYSPSLEATTLSDGTASITLNALTFTGGAWAAVVVEDAWHGPANRTLFANDLEVTDLWPSGYGIAVAGDAYLDHVHVHDYHGSGIHVGGDLTLEQSVIEDLEVDDQAAEFNAVFVEGNATLDEVLIQRNGPPGATLPLTTFPTDEYPFEGGTDYLVAILGQAQISGARFEDNVASRNVLQASALSMSYSTLDHNWAFTSVIESENLDLRHVAATKNGGVTGGAINGAGTISDSTISGNVITYDDGSNYARAPGIGGYGPLLLTRSTVTDNHGPTVGGISADDDLTIHESTIAGNTSLGRVGPLAQNAAGGIAFTNAGHTASLRNSVISSTTSACNLAGATVVSQGHNFDSDGTCGLSDPTDVSAGGDPLLGALSDNGGTTETMLPEPLSPLLDRIPPGTPGCDATTAQNGVTRPQGPGCDIGAAERHLGGYHAVTPTRVLDSRDGTGGWITPLGAGETRSLQLSGLPGDVEAVALNVTITDATAASHLTTWPAGRPKPTASTLNWSPGQTLANAATVPVGAGNAISVFNNAGAVDVIVDVVGWYDNGELAGQSCPCGAGLSVGNPWRAVDTRTGLGGLGGPMESGQTVSFDILPTFVTAPTAAVVNITAVQPSANTHLTAWAADATMPATSNLNLPAGDVRANLAVVPVAPDGTIKVRNNSGDTHLLIDVYGWFGRSGARFRAVSPRRILDSRDGTGGWPGPLGPEQTATLPNSALPPGTALVGNLTAVFPTRATHLSVYPTGSTTNTSAINLPAGDVRANQLLVLSGPGITIRNNAGTTHTILDVTGYFG